MVGGFFRAIDAVPEVDGSNMVLGVDVDAIAPAALAVTVFVTPVIKPICWACDTVMGRVVTELVPVAVIVFVAALTPDEANMNFCAPFNRMRVLFGAPAGTTLFGNCTS